MCFYLLKYMCVVLLYSISICYFVSSRRDLWNSGDDACVEGARLDSSPVPRYVHDSSAHTRLGHRKRKENKLQMPHPGPIPSIHPQLGSSSQLPRA